jgi:hypothetical protein
MINYIFNCPTFTLYTGVLGQVGLLYQYDWPEVDAGTNKKFRRRKKKDYIRWLEGGDEESLMDDAKLRDTTANVLSRLPSETKQLGLSNPPPLTALQPRFAHASHPLQPISFVDWFPALQMWLHGIHLNGSWDSTRF